MAINVFSLTSQADRETVESRVSISNSQLFHRGTIWLEARHRVKKQDNGDVKMPCQINTSNLIMMLDKIYLETLVAQKTHRSVKALP